MIEESAVFLLSFAAGGFIYIAATDLIPEIRKETDVRRSILVFEFFILGVLIMWLVSLIFQHGNHTH
jgi:zinc and cadmium transporter